MARILHIEDDPKSRLLVRKILAAAGHEIVDAATGLDGIRLAAEQRPDLVLVDINVPELDGYEITLRIRGIAGLSQVPIVAITAEGDRTTSLAVGCDGFIEKPIDARKFPKLIEKFLRGHREPRETTSGEQHLRQASQRIVERLETKVVELSKANERLEEMMRLRREYLRNLSHELATPMTPVVGYLRLLLNEELGPLTAKQKKALTSVDASTSRLRSLIETLLDVSSLETGRLQFHPRDYDFAQLAARAVEESRPRFVARELPLEVAIGGEALSGFGDADKIRRAMVHLLDNAAKFTTDGGSVRVQVARSGQGDELSYELSVADSGPGVPAAQLPRILEPFYQVDGSVTRAHGGVGLGLAFARRVGEAHGGDLLVRSPPRPALVKAGLGGTEAVLKVRARPRIAGSASPYD